jgi:ubiquinone/menaquinone biosynthesis C-methylase UbiE
MVNKSWQLGNPGSLPYRLFDALRRWVNQKLVGFLMERALQPSSNRVLEAGSGPAFASSMIAQQPAIQLSVALDIDPEALGEARQRDPNLCAVVADLYHLPFKSECMTLVWNSSTLEHLDTREKALLEMQRVTQKGGHVFVGVPFLYGPLGFQRWIANTDAGVWIGTVFDTNALQALMRSVKLEPKVAISYFFRIFVGVLAQK